MKALEEWFSSKGWKPFDFQREVWRAYLEGKSGLVHSATGTGKTYAAWLGPVAQSLAEGAKKTLPLRVLWITPLRALAADTQLSMQIPVQDLGLPWSIESRTGDTSSAIRARQAQRLPSALITTPESLSLMLTRSDAGQLFEDLRLIVVDEWHELMSSKRGVQTELCMAHLRRLQPSVSTWGLSATLGNLQEAMDTLVGPGNAGVLIKGDLPKEIVIDSILPPNIQRFPWAGHLGTSMIPSVIKAIEEGGTSLIFTNTRAMAELWYQQILASRPDWAETLALHHGSLSREVRDDVEAGLKDGRLRAVVCTSSLDLGVDFSPVDRVLQVGSPKGVARLLQRAGRSGHQPGVPSRVTCVPTHALEMVDISSARRAAQEGRIESRESLDKPLDVLAQHLITLACGEGFRDQATLAEVRSTKAYKDLTDAEWNWCLDFVTRGGESLRAYPEFNRVVETDGVYLVPDKQTAKRHRMSIGTIVSDAAMSVQYLKGGHLGTVEESFLARLKPGDRFIFAGKPLQFVRIKDMTAWVRRAPSAKGAIPRWMGGRLALSGELSAALREELGMAKFGQLDSPEMQALAPLLEIQARWSSIPDVDELLIERLRSREGHHLFFYPFEGRLVHQGLAALFAYRIAKIQPLTFTMASNDYGFELLSVDEAPLDEALEAGLMSPSGLAEDITASLNSVELARRQFREIARVAGLVFQGYPGAGKTARQLQASSGLFYDVFAKYDPSNMLLHQAHKEVLERQLEQTRLARALQRLFTSRILLAEPPKPTPMAFPLLIDRLRESLSSEGIGARIERMAADLEKAAGAVS